MISSRPLARLVLAALLIVICGALSGCGIRGPLVLPEPARNALAEK